MKYDPELSEDFGIGSDFERERHDIADDAKLARMTTALDEIFSSTSSVYIRPTGRRLSSGRDFMVPGTVDEELAEAAINYLRRVLDSEVVS